MNVFELVIEDRQCVCGGGIEIVEGEADVNFVVFRCKRCKIRYRLGYEFVEDFS